MPFFKALLFLGAGAVIHAVHSNNMSDMGGLREGDCRGPTGLSVVGSSLAGSCSSPGSGPKTRSPLPALGNEGYTAVMWIGIAGAFVTHST